MEINLKNIKSFIEGNYYYYKDKYYTSPSYIKEQVEYRLNICKDDCLVNKSCKYCGCPPEKKSWASISCNNNERFPDLMDKDSWESYKESNGIRIY